LLRFIGESDLKDLLNNLGEKVTDEEIVDMIREVDADLDGQVITQSLLVRFEHSC
jgi:Ca2+-binding EF-hand superfamily protein